MKIEEVFADLTPAPASRSVRLRAAEELQRRKKEFEKAAEAFESLKEVS